METPMVIIPMKEYEEMKEIKDRVFKAFNDGQIIIRHETMFYNSSTREHYQLANTNQVVNYLIEANKHLYDQNVKQGNTIYNLEEKIKTLTTKKPSLW